MLREELNELKRQQTQLACDQRLLRRAKNDLDAPLPNDPVEQLLGQENDAAIVEAQIATSQAQREIAAKIIQVEQQIHSYSGMTVNERLYGGGYMADRDTAVLQRNKEKMTELLGCVNLTEQADLIIDAALKQKK